MTDWHIAQMNVADAVATPDDPKLAEFMAQLDEINALAEASPGFVWRLKSDSGNATDILVSDDPYFLINMSVWEGVEALFDYVYKTAHTDVMRRRKEWFKPPSAPYMVLWWVPAGHVPTPQEGLDRLAHLRANGPTPHAFPFRERFPAPAEADAAD